MSGSKNDKKQNKQKQIYMTFVLYSETCMIGFWGGDITKNLYCNKSNYIFQYNYSKCISIVLLEIRWLQWQHFR